MDEKTENAGKPSNEETGAAPVSKETAENAAQPGTGHGSGLQTSGGFRIGDKITMSALGGGNVSLLLAGNPVPIKVSEAELSNVLLDAYFSEGSTVQPNGTTAAAKGTTAA